MELVFEQFLKNIFLRKIHFFYHFYINNHLIDRYFSFYNTKDHKIENTDQHFNIKNDITFFVMFLTKDIFIGFDKKSIRIYF